MNIRTRQKDNVTILDLEGNIDINASDFIETIGQALLSGTKNILCNFEGINLIDYVGISIIAVAYKNVLNHKGSMKAVNVPGHVKNLFSVVGINRVLETYETEDVAINSFQEDTIIAQILADKLRRRFKRIPLHTLIEYKQKFSPKSTFFKGKVVNLSGIGVFMVAQKIFSIGELVTLRLSLNQNAQALEVDAKVVWLADKDIQPDHSPGMGLEFYNIPKNKQAQLIDTIDKNLTLNSTE